MLKEAYADRIKESGIDWRSEDTQEEYAVLDRANRVQIPQELIDGLNLGDNKVKIITKDGDIIIKNPNKS